MKYLPKETSEYLVSLGCTSESGFEYSVPLPETAEDDAMRESLEDLAKQKDYIDARTVKGGKWGKHFKAIPAFSLEDILRKDNAEKIWGKQAYPFVVLAVQSFRAHPDTWPEEVARLIHPSQ